jgi:hypothetical protein
MKAEPAVTNRMKDRRSIPETAWSTPPFLA